MGLLAIIAAVLLIAIGPSNVVWQGCVTIVALLVVLKEDRDR